MSPFKPLPEFEHLSPADLDQIHDLLYNSTYKETQDIIREHLGIEVSINKLFRYKQRLDLAHQLSSVEDTAVGIDDLLNLFNGKPVPFSDVGLQIVLKRALELVASPSTSPALLKDLFRIFTWKDRKSFAERRLALAERKQDFTEKTHPEYNVLTVEQSNAAARELVDPILGPLTPEELGEVPWGYRPSIEFDPEDPLKCLDDPNLIKAMSPVDDTSPSAIPISSPITRLPASPASPVFPASSAPLSSAPESPSSASTPASPASQCEIGIGIDQPLHPDTHTATAAETNTGPASDSEPCPLSLTQSHALRRWASHTPRPPGIPQPDESWTEECPCGNKLPCLSHQDLWREVRYLKPWDTAYQALLQREGIPIFTPFPHEDLWPK